MRISPPGKARKLRCERPAGKITATHFSGVEEEARMIDVALLLPFVLASVALIVAGLALERIR